MNREILFRGKRTDNGKWICGYYFYDDFYKKAYITVGNYCMSLDIERPNKKILTVFEVVPKTVGQYTGLTDKNGTKIFEGDILEFTDSDGEKTLYEIRYSKFSLAWYICQCDDKTAWDNCEFWVNERFEVISNIHDNPELLEQEG